LTLNGEKEGSAERQQNVSTTLLTFFLRKEGTFFSKRSAFFSRQSLNPNPFPTPKHALLLRKNANQHIFRQNVLNQHIFATPIL
jgi:hypothetical protein